MSSKILFGVLGTTAATATIAAPATLLTAGGGSLSEEIKIGNTVTQIKFKDFSWEGKKINIAQSSDVKSKYKEIDCLKDYFTGNGDWNTEPSTNTDEPSLDLQGSDKGNLKGCLLIEYYHIYPSNKGNKWWGGLKLIWTLANDKQGLIVTFNSHTDEGKLKIDSSVYTVGKESDKWLIKYKQENKEEIISTNDEVDKKFPKSAERIDSNGQKANHWDFGANPSNICGDNECKEVNHSPDKTDKPVRLDWQKSNDNKSKEISSWCANFDSWFDSLFPDGKGNKLKAQLKEIKGTWKEQE